VGLFFENDVPARQRLIRRWGHGQATLGVECLHEGRQCTRFDCRAQISHKALVMTQIMDGVEHGTEHFVAAVEMVQIAP
jgi:hypothetical protein